MQPNHGRKNVNEEYSELLRRSVRDEAQQLLRQWTAEAHQRQQSFMGNNGASSSRTQSSWVPRTIAYEDRSAVVWVGADERGHIHGPFSLNLLSICYQLGYFTPDFRVWKIGQYPSQSLLLLHLLNS
nr:zinc finger CCCH domain-containing protein 44 [Ipomoea batatas]